ncbi:MAG: repressor LexA [Deltaproteobacteria bacterium]|nr:repressor LexA [Deltaproteobacteria bacterium]
MGRTPHGQTRHKIFKFVRQRLRAGRPPTVREVQQAFGFSAVETARSHLDALVEQGLLEKESGKARGYRLPPGGRERPLFLIPLLGRVQAGALTTAVEEIEGFLPVDVRGAEEDLFALRVRGESMVGVGILPGDIVIVRRQPTAASGDVVVALVDDEATVKTLHVRGGAVELVPASPHFKKIVVEPDALTLLGKVIEVRRVLEPTA